MIKYISASVTSPEGTEQIMLRQRNGEYVKWSDVENMLNNAVFYRGYDPAKPIRGWDMSSGKLHNRLGFCIGADND